MAAILEPADVFVNFIRQLGLREETAQGLWQGNIKSPQELAASPQEKLRQIVDDSVLVDYIHPILRKYTFPITIAADPYAHALSLLRKEAAGGAPQTQNQSHTQSDAQGFVDGTGTNSAAPSCNGDSTSLRPAVMAVESNVEMNGQPYARENRGTSATVQITGGTFVQSNVLPQKEVNYNNTGTRILVSSMNGQPAKPLIMRRIDLKDYYFSDTNSFTLNESSQVKKSPTSQGMDPNAFPIHNWGQSRALILNNMTFPGCSNREGADSDSRNLKNILQQLGFKVDSHFDKRRGEILQILREFTASTENEHAPMVLVFIGSHGQRDANQDWFIGTDGERISDEEVANLFTPTAAPLIKKETPKLFFFQFCRQNKADQTQSDSIVDLEDPRTFAWLNKGTQSDAGPDTDPAPATNDPAQKYANMLFAFATAPGTKAFRDIRSGSWFVTTLCKILMEKSSSEDLLSMLTMVNAAVMKQKGMENDREVVQMSEVKSYLTKKVKFY